MWGDSACPQGWWHCSSAFCCRVKAGSCLAGGGGQWMPWGCGRDVGCHAISSSSGRIPEAPDLGTRPQQALEPQPRPADRPRPQPSRERASCSWGGLGGSGLSAGVQTAPRWGRSCSPQGYTGGAAVSSRESYPRSRSGDSAVGHGEGVMGAKASPPNVGSPGRCLPQQAGHAVLRGPGWQ